MSVRRLLWHITRLHPLRVLMISVCALPGWGQRAAGDEQFLPVVTTREDVAAQDIVGVIQRIEFRGLRRVSANALRRSLSTREGDLFDAARVESDVRALDRFGWFDSARATLEEMPASGSASGAESPSPVELLRLVFIVEERPFLAGVEFRGSRVLSHEYCSELLREKNVVLKKAAPVNPVAVWRAARILEAELAERGHPQAAVRVRLEQVPTASVRVVFDIRDGPRITVGQVHFAGNRAFSEKQLRRQMKRIAPHVRLVGLRGRNIYTLARLEEDRDRVTNMYHNHGYPEARVGRPEAQVVEDRAWRWLPWPHQRTQMRYAISIPVEEGRMYRWGEVQIYSELFGKMPTLPLAERAVRDLLKPGTPYSQQSLERARELLARVSLREAEKSDAPTPEVEAQPQFESRAGIARVTFQVRAAQPYIVRRIEFLGARRFTDHYYRRRILLKEGERFDTRKLELGLAQLSRTGFIRPVRKEDVRVRFDEAKRLADLTVRVEEVGQQRFSLVGGHSNLGSTLGVVYNVFNLLGGEELMTAHLEGGPQSLQMLLGVAKDGVFGTRVSLGLSLFRNVIRPNLPGAFGRRRLFSSDNSGFGAAWTYPLTPRDTLALNYQLAQTSTLYNLPLSAISPGLPGNGLRVRTASRSIGVSESHEADRERIVTAASVSGGWLGGGENLLRFSVEYARFQPDPVTNQRNTLAFRGYLAGAASYRGELPLYARFFPGDELVRGFRTGELAPYAVVSSSDAQGQPVFRGQSAGASLVGAVNTEYRVPVAPRTEIVTFFDAGSGWLLPGWLGPNPPKLLDGTSGVLRASTGLELRWRLPLAEQPLRVHYTVNPVRLAKAFLLPDGLRFRPPDRRTALGWALGAPF